jgi:hypothetical protein
LLYSSDSSDGLGNSIQTTYNTPQEIDDLGTGGTWSNSDPSGSVTEKLADGGGVTRTIAANGSYTDTQTYANGAKATITVSSALDGSGNYHLNVGALCNGEVVFAYGAPSGGNITLSITDWGFNSAGKCVQGGKSRTFPAWFPGWFTPGKSTSYITDGFADNGTQAFDKTCNVPSTIATSGTQIVETYNLLDPVLGYTETRTTTTYDVAGYGPACVVIADTVNSFYDYADDTTRIDYQSENGKPNSVNTIAETLSVQSGACGGGGSPPCAQLRRAQTVKPVSPIAIAGRIAAIEHQRAVERAQRLSALRAFALHFVHQGAVR